MHLQSCPNPGRILRRLWRPLAVLGLIWCLVYRDNIWLGFRWQRHEFWRKFGYEQGGPTEAVPWSSFGNASFPIDPYSELGIIIKTGYQRTDSLIAVLDTLSQTRNPTNTIIVSDYAVDAVQAKYNETVYTVLDGLKSFVESSGVDKTAERIHQYFTFHDAIRRKDKKLLATVNGWELDIMKHIPGLEIGLKAMPGKKWYVMIDDDTYLHEPSLVTVLSHLDFTQAHYLGSTTGDYRVRFAHGGSGVVLSQAAMHRVFVEKADTTAELSQKSLTAILGDRLISEVLMGSGIYAEEQYAIFFNGNHISDAEIRSDRFCAPMVSFHHLSPVQMMETRELMKNYQYPLTWFDLWEMGDAPALDAPKAARREGWDYTRGSQHPDGHLVEAGTLDACENRCLQDSAGCLAWVWNSTAADCYICPWMTVGMPRDDTTSGINVLRAQKLSSACQPIT